MAALRTVAERLLRDRTRRRMLPIIVSSAGGMGILFKPMTAVDPELFATVRALVKPGHTVWDIGANVGLFTFAAAGIAGAAGKVFSFEPDTSLVALLRQSRGLQPERAANVTIVPCGVAGATGIRSFSIASRARASNALSDYGNSQMGGVRETQTIVCFSADALLDNIAAPDVVKIDVEGAEVELLCSASKLLGSVRPSLAVEVGPDNASAVTSILNEHGYTLFAGPDGYLNRTPIRDATWNTIAIPSEKLG
jgi:FkbM family methyltransferase